MKNIYTNYVIWNVFDYVKHSEIYWNILNYDESIARKIAIALTIIHPFLIIPVVIDCYRYEHSKKEA